MRDHHCIYQHGWFMEEWCDQCGMDFIHWKHTHPGLAHKALVASYEAEISRYCDEEVHPPQPQPEPLVYQLVLPWDQSVEPASEEAMFEAFRRVVVEGVCFSLAQLAPSDN